jgi:prevent-host-death family protein
MVMIVSIGVAALKARLSEHLRIVKDGGIVTILEHGKPVAQLVPHVAPAPMAVREPRAEASRGFPGFQRPAYIPLGGVDVMDVLSEERQSHR